MADPVKQTETPKPPAVKPAPKAAEPKAVAAKPAGPGEAAPKAAAPKAVAPKVPAPKQTGKARLEPINVNMGRCGVAQESALPYKNQPPRRRQAGTGCKTTRWSKTCSRR